MTILHNGLFLINQIFIIFITKVKAASAKETLYKNQNVVHRIN